MLWSFAYFFSVLCAYYILRPLRDEMGVTVGQDGLKWLFVIVFLVMLAAVPVFGWVVSRFPRRRIVPVIYGFFIANLAMFWVAFQAGMHGAVVAGTFFVWVSVFNLFVVSLFWSLMSDLWRNDQAKRLYGFIAAGGSAGAFAGPLITQGLVRLVGPNNLLIVSGLLLGVSIAAALDAAAAVRRRRRGTGRGGAGRAARPARRRAGRVALALPVQDRLVDPARQFRRHVLLSGAGPHRRRDADGPDSARGAVRPRRPGGERADDPGAGIPGRAHHADVRRRAYPRQRCRPRRRWG